MTVNIINGDCRAIVPTLKADSFDCIVTSPPYWGLRDYGVDGQIGLEPTLDSYVETMAALGDELWRVLKPEGTFWLNLGDSYSGGGRGGRPADSPFRKQATNAGSLVKPPKWSETGLKPKDLCGVPWRVAFALQSRGWWLRSAIIWHKPNPMPESVTDRPTSAYEMVFLLTKAERYFYDADAIREVGAEPREFLSGTRGDGSQCDVLGRSGRQALGPTGFGTTGSRNARNVWTVSTKPFSGSHFATMPPDLAERCIRAGCPIGGRVLDPFGGAGTTGLVADRLGRSATLIELNPAYRDMASNRVQDDSPLFANVVV